MLLSLNTKPIVCCKLQRPSNDLYLLYLLQIFLHLFYPLPDNNMLYTWPQNGLCYQYNIRLSIQAAGWERLQWDYQTNYVG